MQPTGRASRLCTFLALAWAALLLFGAVNSSADIEFCPFGSGTGQCRNTGGVAVDRAGGHVYVADAGNNRVNVFDEDGTFLSSFGTPGSGAGQFTSPRKLAVDNDPTSPNFGDVFVTDGSPRVQRFNSVGVFEAIVGIGQLNTSNPPISLVPGGNLYAVDSAGSGASEPLQLKIFSPAGALVGSSILSVESLRDAVSDSLGVTYLVSFSGDEKTLKYEPVEPIATLLGTFDPVGNTTALAVDGSDNLYSAQRDNGFRAITKRDPSGAIVKRFGYGEIPFENLAGLAVGASGDLFASRTYFGETEGNNAVRIPQPAPGPLPCCLTATPGNTKATLVGGVNPEGKSTTYHFEYVTEDDYVLNGFADAALTPESASIGSDFDLHIDPPAKGDPPPVSAQIGCTSPTVPPQPTCLKPKTEYRYRLVATNSDGKSTSEGTFETLAPFEIKATWATDVGIGEARVHASVNPLGIPASAQFEFIDDASFQASGFADAGRAPSSPITLGSSEAEVSVSTQLSSLVPDTTYHYRVAVSDPFAEETGPEHTFKTYPAPTAPTTDCPNQQFRIAASAPLPDCRAYEMVSPVDKNGNDIEVLVSGQGYPARLDQSSDDGNRFAYSSNTAFGDAQSAPWSSEYMATRTEGQGWSTHSLNPPRVLPSFTTQPVIKLDVQYKAFSSDLDDGWLFHDANPMLDECAPEGFMNLYRRDNTTGEYEALITNPPMNTLADYRLELQGLSADHSHAIFRANAKLTDDASGASGALAYQVYMHVAGEGCGELRLVSFKPNGTAMTPATSVGSPAQPGEYRRGTVARAVSADGSRVFFTTNPNPISTGPLYVRVNADQEQSEVEGGKCAEADKGCTLQITTEGTQFWTAPTDGSRVIYSVGEELFEFDVDKAVAGEPAKTLIAAKARGVAGASEDASRIYFVSREAIDGEGKAGEPNLYLYEPAHGGPERYRLVATLSQQDFQGIAPYSLLVAGETPIANGVRLSADGSHLVFVSQASLTGYDNLDALTGEPNIEVYLYDTASEAVHCISCNPSGARPRGRRLGEGSAFRLVSAMMAPGESQTFNPRALSADGNRLFFESFEALLPRDTNGKADVYEWMRAGGGSVCEEAGAELYVPSSEGCLSLISSGQSPVDTEFADASPDGSDVFIRTQSSLLPQDDGLVDIYDARVNGGLPQPPAPPAACEGEACQGPLSAPDDPTPASSAFEGAGNVNEAVVKKKKAKKQKKHTKKHQKKKKKSKARHNRRTGR